MATNEQKCKRIFKAALQSLDGSYQPTTFLRELFMTAKGCDEFHDLSSLRNSIEEDLGKEPMDRITNYQENYSDILRARQMIFRYRSWANTELKKASV